MLPPPQKVIIIVMERLKTLIPGFEGKKVLVIGDLMLDEHIWSKVNRISPEAPVPIAQVSKITHVPGGCGNVAANIKTLSGTPLLMGLVGTDSSGQKLIKALKGLKIDTAYVIRTKDRPTILKSRIIDASQQVIRVDREDSETIPQELETIILNKLKKNIAAADATFRLGDVYAFPNPAKRANPTIHAEVGIADSVKIRIYDISGYLHHERDITNALTTVNGKYAYEYAWNVSGTGSGVYILIVHAKKSGYSDITAKTKFAVIR